MPIGLSSYLVNIQAVTYLNQSSPGRTILSKILNVCWESSNNTSSFRVNFNPTMI